MSTTGARYGSKIYSTVEAGQPYRWKLGDGSTIPGLEEAVSSMTPGGIRRVIIPAKLAYQSKAALSIRKLCVLMCLFCAVLEIHCLLHVSRRRCVAHSVSIFQYPHRARATNDISFLLVGDECENGKGLGPIPPASEAIGEFQRFKNIYCNPDRVYQPDLVMDVKLYGKR